MNKLSSRAVSIQSASSNPKHKDSYEPMNKSSAEGAPVVVEGHLSQLEHFTAMLFSLLIHALSYNLLNHR